MSGFYDFLPGGWREPIYFADYLVEAWRFQSVGRDADARLLLVGIWAWAMDGIRTEQEVRVALRLLDRVGFATDSSDEWAALDDELVVYRAETHPGLGGLCWTLDREVADHFAGRHGLDVRSGMVAKQDVLAYITHHGENEVIARPASVRGLIADSTARPDA